MDKGQQQEQKQPDLPPIYERLDKQDQKIAYVETLASGNLSGLSRKEWSVLIGKHWQNAPIDHAQNEDLGAPESLRSREEAVAQD